MASPVKRKKMMYHCKFGDFETEPVGVTINAQNDIIVAIKGNIKSQHKKIKIFHKEGRFKFQFGEMGYRDGQLLNPHNVAVFKNTGNIVVTRRGGANQVQVYSRHGHFIRKFGNNILQQPNGVCVDSMGRIIVVDCKHKWLIIFDHYGNLLKMFGCSQHLQFPNGVAVNDCQEIFISDYRGHCVKVFNYDGNFMRQIGGEGITNYPEGVGINIEGDIIIADNHNNFHLTVFSQDGLLISALESKVNHGVCYGIAVMDDGNVVLASQGLNKDYKLYIYKNIQSTLMQFASHPPRLQFASHPPRQLALPPPRLQFASHPPRLGDHSGYICVTSDERKIGELFQLPLNPDYTLSTSTLREVFPDATGLYYYSPDNLLLGVFQDEEKLFPPINGDGLVYVTRKMRYSDWNSFNKKEGRLESQDVVGHLGCNISDFKQEIIEMTYAMKQLRREVSELKDERNILHYGSELDINANIFKPALAVDDKEAIKKNEMKRSVKEENENILETIGFKKNVQLINQNKVIQEMEKCMVMNDSGLIDKNVIDEVEKGIRLENCEQIDEDESIQEEEKCVEMKNVELINLVSDSNASSIKELNRIPVMNTRTASWVLNLPKAPLETERENAAKLIGISTSKAKLAHKKSVFQCGQNDRLNLNENSLNFQSEANVAGTSLGGSDGSNQFKPDRKSPCNTIGQLVIHRPKLCSKKVNKKFINQLHKNESFETEQKLNSEESTKNNPHVSDEIAVREIKSLIKQDEEVLINLEPPLIRSSRKDQQLGSRLSLSVSVNQEESSDLDSNAGGDGNTDSVSVPKHNVFKSLCLPYKPGDLFSVRPTVLSSDAIYCHLDPANKTCDSETFEEHSDCLQDVGDRQPVVNQPKVGMPVIARFKKDRKWYRAVVTNCCPTSVLFVDYGNSEQVEEVRSLPQGMEQLPGQAVLLIVVSGPTQDQLENMVSPEGVLRCRLVEIKGSLTLGSPVVSVEILDPE